MELESIGRNIRKFRLMRNLRQEDLAEMAGLSINYVGALERGEKIPSLETFIVLLNALEVSSDICACTTYRRKPLVDNAFTETFFESMILQQKRIQTPKHDFMVTCASPSR